MQNGWKYLKTTRAMAFRGKIARIGTIVKMAPLDAIYLQNNGSAVEASADEVRSAGAGVIELLDAHIQTAHSF